MDPTETVVAPAQRPDDFRKRRSVAVVDLGSNSFHLLVVRGGRGGIRVVDRMRERVGLERALDEAGRVRGDARRGAVACLEKFRERLRGFDRDCVRAIGTHALRRARDPEFLAEARAALGHDIEVVDGMEEARLVNLGVSAGDAPRGRDRVVVDIGGGSTECIHDREGRILHASSASVGCVSGTERFFGDGSISKRRFDDAIAWAHDHLRDAGCERVGCGFHDDAVGASGTINAIQRILHESGVDDHQISREGLHVLRKALVDAKRVARAKLGSLGDERRVVLPGGVAVLIAAFEALGIDRLRAVPYGLRDGLVRDLLGRVAAEDRREVAVQRAMRCCAVDPGQALRVARTAEHLRASVSASWELDAPEARHLLDQAARLHEVGLALSHAGYHRHGEYFLRHGDLVGFSTADRTTLATLVRFHRRKLVPAAFALHPVLSREQQRRLCCVLRLAVLLNRARTDRSLEGVRLEAKGRKLLLRMPRRELAPMTVEDLDAERGYLAAASISLEVRWEG